MMNFNPATFWWQWMLDQLDDYGDGGEGVPKLSLRLALAGQLAAMKSYRDMLKAADDSGSIRDVNAAVRKLADDMLAAAQKQQPSAVKAQIDMLNELIAKLEDEQKKASDPDPAKAPK